MIDALLRAFGWYATDLRDELFVSARQMEAQRVYVMEIVLGAPAVASRIRARWEAEMESPERRLRRHCLERWTPIRERLRQAHCVARWAEIRPEPRERRIQPIPMRREASGR